MTNDQTNDQNQRNEGPLRLPPPPTREAARALRRLGGYSTSALWLAEGLHPELDEQRGEHLRLRSQVLAELDALAALHARFLEEDEQHKSKLRQAQRDGTVDAVEDDRTPLDQQQAERAAVEERLWAGVSILAEIAEKVIQWVREHEQELLAERLSGVAALEEEERQARDALAQARCKMWELAQYGPYVKNLADDGPFGRQPVPVPAEPPAQFDAVQARRMLERHWSKPQPGIGDDGQPIRSWLEQSQDRDVESLETEDTTGEVSDLVETNEGASS
jgi:hypothetical protein